MTYTTYAPAPSIESLDATLAERPAFKVLRETHLSGTVDFPSFDQRSEDDTRRMQETLDSFLSLGFTIRADNHSATLVILARAGL